MDPKRTLPCLHLPSARISGITRRGLSHLEVRYGHVALNNEMFLKSCFFSFFLKAVSYRTSSQPITHSRLALNSLSLSSAEITEIKLPQPTLKKQPVCDFYQFHHYHDSQPQVRKLQLCKHTFLSKATTEQSPQTNVHPISRRNKALLFNGSLGDCLLLQNNLVLPY